MQLLFILGFFLPVAVLPFVDPLPCEESGGGSGDRHGKKHGVQIGKQGKVDQEPGKIQQGPRQGVPDVLCRSGIAVAGVHCLLLELQHLR